MRRIFICAILMFVCFSITVANPPKTQQITFQYDTAGNRILRLVIETVKKSDSLAIQLADMLKDELLIDLNSQESLFQTRVYPNPAQDLLQIETDMPEIGETTCHMYDLGGRLVYKSDRISTFHSLNLASYQPGTYVIILTNSESQVIYKIIKN